MGKISLIIIEDHDILRDSLVTTLMMKDFHVAGNFLNAGDALLFLAGNDVDFAVVDYMPEKYLGTLKDYVKKLKLINPGIKSGCLNDE